MAIIFSALYRQIVDGKAVVMPSGHWNNMAKWAAHFAKVGIQVVLDPSPCWCIGGVRQNQDGYGINNGYRYESWFGTREEKAAEVATLHANGIDAWSDFVTGQYQGGKGGSYLYDNWAGIHATGPFQKDAKCFVFGPNDEPDDQKLRPWDTVFDLTARYRYGDMCRYDRANRYMLNGKMAEILDQVDSFDLDGGRLDNTKGTSIKMQKEVIEMMRLRGLRVVGEYYSSDPEALDNWVDAVGGAASTFDFEWHWACKRVADNGGSCYQLFHGNSYRLRNPMHAVAFPENADTDNIHVDDDGNILNYGTQIVNNKLLVYVLTLMGPGDAVIYARDYMSDPGCYGMGKEIDKIIFAARMLNKGTIKPLYAPGNDKAAIWSANGNGGVYGWSGGFVAGVNFDPFNPREVWVPTPFGPNVEVQDYLGHCPNTKTNGDGWMLVKLPKNTNNKGVSSCIYSRAGMKWSVPVVTKTTTQVFTGGDHRYDIGPVRNGPYVIPFKIHAAAKTKLRIDFEYDKHMVEFKDASVSVSVWDPNKKEAPLAMASTLTGNSAHTEIIVDANGWYAFEVMGNGLLPKEGCPFTLTVTYTGVK